MIRRRSLLRSAGLATRARASNDHGGLAVAELDCISRSAGPYRFSRSCVEKTTSPTIRTWPCASSVPRVTARHRRQHEEELPQRAQDAGWRRLVSCGMAWATPFASRPRRSRRETKTLHMQGFHEADEGTRTLDLLHGKREGIHIVPALNPGLSWLSTIANRTSCFARWLRVAGDFQRRAERETPSKSGAFRILGEGKP